MNVLLSQADKLELGLCLRVNWLSRFRPVVGLFRIVSRLGDGVFWYSLMTVFAVLYGWQGVAAMLHVGFTSLVGVGIYTYLKERLVRPRPFVSHGQIVCQTAPLDQYSFPSGHTLHAVLFTTMLSAYVPTVFGALLIFAVLVAISRVVLGLHYPSDVVVGALLGSALAMISMTLIDVTPLVSPDTVDQWQIRWVSLH
ncbi:MAG: phosphatase PAP2 family protein [Pseudomonadota bacterium]